MIKSYDDTLPVNSQSNCVIKKITPKFSKDTFTQFIKTTMTNESQGGKVRTCNECKVRTYPRHKKDVTSQGFHINNNYILT